MKMIRIFHIRVEFFIYSILLYKFTCRITLKIKIFALQNVIVFIFLIDQTNFSIQQNWRERKTRSFGNFCSQKLFQILVSEIVHFLLISNPIEVCKWLRNTFIYNLVLVICVPKACLKMSNWGSIFVYRREIWPRLPLRSISVISPC